MFLIWRNTCGSILGAKTSFGRRPTNPNAKVLLLEVQPPAIGVFSLVSGAYDESLLLKEW
ncbi:hypothetical protein H5410_014555 [Solanum commersonii]|uniref:Uncharacterized protein n=1 Tax=Solanum commersonii TaxID=4109 RepID=A0A9J5ZRK1_SOLCO|nr:hypothetical protein H5410_014555 [Solanum commersonii]